MKDNESLTSKLKELNKIVEIAEETDLSKQNNYFVLFDKQLKSTKGPKLFSIRFDRWERYNQILRQLSGEDFKIFKKKIIPLATIRDKKRGWEQLFSILEELEGFNYLKKEQSLNPHFVSEYRQGETPDLYDKKAGAVMEVKTNNVSDVNLEKIQERELIRGRRNLPDNLKEKIKNIVSRAKDQIKGFCEGQYCEKNKRFIFLSINLDTSCDIEPEKFRVQKQIEQLINDIERDFNIVISFQ